MIGLSGNPGSGKDTAASYIKKKYGAEEFRFSYMLFNVLKILGIPVSRENLDWLVNTFKRKFGNDSLTRAIKKTIEERSRKKIVVINGIRLPSDYELVRSFKKNVLIYLKVNERVRWQRVRQRNEKADDNVSFAKFKKMHLAENEKYVCEIGKKADYVVDNNGTFVDFRRKIDEVMKKIKN